MLIRNDTPRKRSHSMKGILYTHVLPFKWWGSRKALRDHTLETDVVRVDAAAEAKSVAYSQVPLVSKVYGWSYRQSGVLSRCRGRCIGFIWPERCRKDNNI